MAKTFAPDLARDEKGRIIFPRDVEWRRKLFVPESMQHPAKANMHLVQAIYRYVGEPGETLMDVMSGTGTLMMAAVEGYKVICLEIEPVFHFLQLESYNKLVMEHSVNPELVLNLHGDCRVFLPLPVDHIIFSPPYANTLKFTAKADSTKALGGSTYMHQHGEGSVFDDYQGSKGNLGRQTSFFFNQEMKKIYGLCLESLRPGGTLTIIIQDQMRQQKRVGLTEWAVRTCCNQGFEMQDWFMRYSEGTGYKKLLKSKGYSVVDEEDVVILRKPA